MRLVSDTDLGMRRGKIRFKLWCLAPPGIELITTPMEDRGARGDESEHHNNMRTTNKSEVHTFGEIGSEILVQLVKVCFGDDNGIQRRIIGALVRRTLWLERAVLIARDPRVGGRGWGGRRTGGARRPFHGVHSARAVERGRETGRRKMRRPFSVNTHNRRQSASQYCAVILLTSALFSRRASHME